MMIILSWISLASNTCLNSLEEIIAALTLNDGISKLSAKIDDMENTSNIKLIKTWIYQIIKKNF